MRFRARLIWSSYSSAGPSLGNLFRHIWSMIFSLIWNNFVKFSPPPKTLNSPSSFLLLPPPLLPPTPSSSPISIPLSPNNNAYHVCRKAKTISLRTYIQLASILIHSSFLLARRSKALLPGKSNFTTIIFLPFALASSRTCTTSSHPFSVLSIPPSP